MPSHQSRRESLPSNYQFGDGGQEPYWVFLPPKAYAVLLSFVEPHLTVLGRLVATDPRASAPRRRSLYLKDVLFLEGEA